MWCPPPACIQRVDKPRVEVHPLDIGGKADPARLVFTGSKGDAIDVTVADFRAGFKFISYEVEATRPQQNKALFYP